MALHDVSRTEAGLRHPRRITRFSERDIQALVVHYSTGEELGQPDALAWWRSIQAYHMSKDWADVGYAYGIHAREDRVLEGRGIGVIASHSPGWNARSVSICVLGDDDPGQDVLDHTRNRLVRFRDAVFTHLGRKVSVLGHRQTQPRGYTQCPGDELVEWLVAGMPGRYPVEPRPVTRAVAVTAAREPDQTSARYVAMRHGFAYVEPADSGWYEPALTRNVEVQYLVAIGYRARELVRRVGDGHAVVGSGRGDTEAHVAGLLFGPPPARRRPWAS